SVTLLVLKEHSSPRRVNDPHRPGPSVIAGLKVFQRDREKDRRRIYRRMVQYWDHLQRTGSWEDLKGSALSSHKVEYATRIGLTETERREAVLRHVTLYPEGEAHSRHVARLSLQLFDQLRELHQLTEHDRILLEYGCLLHDIGWSRGKKGHARESAAMIHAAGDLPFSLDERGDVGFLACSHRGKDHTGESGYFAILSAERQSALRILAGIIRVADGLDGTHRGRVESVSCEPAADSVTCRVFASQDCAREIRMAKEKADLFEQVFGKHFMPVQERPHPGAGAPLFPAERD
ncbi:MAG: HD domain-containing protein, partial [Deltaproteobacteria bacterium]|nr:HD domain-containing protein [Deltaproteobacteria bacterium]